MLAALFSLIVATTFPTYLSLPTHSLLIAQQSRGAVFYHGNRLMPPFRIEVTYALSPDTVWLATYINRIHLVGATAPARLRTNATRQEVRIERHDAVVDEAFLRGSRLRVQNAPEPQVYRAMRAVFDSASDVVDSTRMLAGDTLAVYWTGTPEPSPTLLSHSHRPAPDARDTVMPAARTLGQALAANCLVILGNSGVVRVLPPALAPLVIAQLDSVGRGLTPAHLIVRDADVLSDMRHPVPLSSMPTKD
jgi:hypothetical protein